MKKLILFGFFSIVIILTSCSDGAIGDDFADTQYAPRGVVLSPENVVTGFFDQLSPSTSSIAFDLTQTGEAANDVDVFVSYNGGGEVLFQSVTSIPSTINVPFTEVLSKVGVAESAVQVGDEITFTFDGTTSSGTYRSSESLKVPVSCFSDLGGTYTYVSTNLVAITNSCPSGEVTGEVTFTDLGGGTYLCSDLGFGQYGSSCWSDSPATSSQATFTDVCNEIQSSGRDQYSLTYIWTITNVSGSDLFISWENDYGDSGDVVITRPDGTNWPSLFTKS